MLDHLVAIDIDGVVRNWDYYIRKNTLKRNYSYEFGSVIFDLVKDQPHLLSTAKQTFIVPIIKKYFNCPTFVSYQKEEWQEGTIKWLDRRFGYYKIIFTSSAEAKLQHYEQFKWVVEDYPYFPKEFYKKVILVDWCYNRKVNYPLIRVSRPGVLSRFFAKILKEEANAFAR